MMTNDQLGMAFLDAPMLHYFRCKFANLRADELQARIEETLKFLFISHQCTGAIPVNRDIDAIWHAWILETREYSTLCGRLPARAFIHHSSNDYLRYFDPSVGERNDLMQEVKMLALYVANFGPFEAGRAKYWLLASHLMERCGWSVEQLNEWLLLPVNA
jgi:hypothetical protein